MDRTGKAVMERTGPDRNGAERNGPERIGRKGGTIGRDQVVCSVFTSLTGL
jgi:hypothetical protein